MKVSVLSDEISHDPETAFELGLEWGIRRFEVRSLWRRRVPDITAEEEQQLKGLAERYGADLVALSPGVFKVAANDKEGVRQHLEERLPRSIDLAKRLGIGVVIVFSLSCDPSERARLSPLAVEALGSAADLAEREGITLVLENEGGYFADTGENTAELVQELGGRSLGVNWDPCNAFYAGETPYPTGYNWVKRFVKHVHLKDARAEETGATKIVAIGSGDLNLQGQVEALKRDGYAGFLTIETHFTPRVRGTRESLQGLRGILSRIGEPLE